MSADAWSMRLAASPSPEYGSNSLERILRQRPKRAGRGRDARVLSGSLHDTADGECDPEVQVRHGPVLERLEPVDAILASARLQPFECAGDALARHADRR